MVASELVSLHKNKELSWQLSILWYWFGKCFAWNAFIGFALEASSAKSFLEIRHEIGDMSLKEITDGGTCGRHVSRDDWKMSVRGPSVMLALTSVPEPFSNIGN